jgi:glycosyltransferase involved in cell wall biosynthesis
MLADANKPTALSSVVHVISTGGLYGAERAMLEIAEHARDRARHVHVLATDGRGIPSLREACAAAALPFTALERADGALAIRSALRRALQTLRPAIVHSHNYKPDILLATIGRASPNERRVSTCHNWLRDTWRVRLWEHLDLRVLRRFDRVVAVSTDVRATLLNGGVPAQRVELIRNGLDFPQASAGDRATFRRAIEMDPALPLLVQIGRLDELKGIDTLLRALALIAPAERPQLALAGDGPSRSRLESLRDQLGLSASVRFLGYRTDISRLLAGADAMVLASHREGSPMVVLEAMACRCPMILTSVGEIPGMFANACAAWLVPPRDAAALARGIAAALRDRTESARRASEAYALYVANYSRSAMGDRYESLYDALTAGAPI